VFAHDSMCFGTAFMCQDAPAGIDTTNVDLVVAADVVYIGTAEAELATVLVRLLQVASQERRSLQALCLLADRQAGGYDFLPSGQQHDPLATPADEDTDDARAVERFLSACRRRHLSIEHIDLAPQLIEDALKGGVSGMGPDGRPDGDLCLYRIWWDHR